MSITRADFESYIKNFQFRELFTELGWDRVVKKQAIAVKDAVFELQAVAHKRDFLVFFCSASNGKMPDATARKKIDREINKLFFEHLLIFIDPGKTKQIWQLSVKEPNKPVVIREITYHVNQKPELLYQKLSGLLFTFDEEGKIGLVDVVKRVSDSFNVNAEKVTKKFYDRFKDEHAKFREFVQGIKESVDRDWYASLMLNRLMFIYFIQKKGFLDENQHYLRDKLKVTRDKKGKNKFYSFYKDFLRVLFHKGLGAPENLRTAETLQEIGRIPYLNGGLFDVHQIEEIYANIAIPDGAFARIFDFFDEFNWHLDTRETASGKDINPDVMGYIFEKYINDRAAMGAYYTKEDITDYISKNCIIPFLFEETKKECANAFREDSSLWQILKENPDRYIYDAVKHGIWKQPSEGLVRELPPEITEGLDTSKPNLLERRKAWNRSAPSGYALPTEIWREVVERRKRYFDIRDKIKNGEINHINDFITYNLDIRQFAQDTIEQYEGSDFVNAFYKAITRITVLDPACGSGAFLFAALNVLEPLYEACIERMANFVVEDDEHSGRKFPQFRKVLDEIKNHPNLRYYIYKSIILNNLYGVDIMNEAVEIAKLRLFLKLMAEVDNIDDVEPMPDIDYNIRAGNTLVGFATYKDVEKTVTSTLDFGGDAEQIREEAEKVGMAFRRFKDAQLIENQGTSGFRQAKYELRQKLATLNDKLNVYLARQYGIDHPERDIKIYENWKRAHQPFHWFAEFYDIIDENGGFDVVIGNPPYLSLNKIPYSFETNNISAGDIYAYMIVRALSLLGAKGKFGYIVMHSLAFSKHFSDIRTQLKNENAYIWFSFFARIPSGLFSGDVRVRNCIFILNRISPSQRKRFLTTRIHRWFSNQRDNLFSLFNYTHFTFNSVVPMFNDEAEAGFLENLQGDLVKTKFSRYSSHEVYFKQNAYNWISASTEPAPCYDAKGRVIPQTQISSTCTSDEQTKKLLLLLYNGKLFFSYWLVYGDEFHVTKDVLGSFVFPFSKLNGEDQRALENLYKEFVSELPNTIQYKYNAGKKVGTFNTAKLWGITDKSDRVFLRYLTDKPKEVFESIEYHVTQTIMTNHKNPGS